MTVVGIINNLQPDIGNKVFGSTSLLIKGRNYIIEEFLGLELRIGVNSFFQVNRNEAEKAVETIIADINTKQDITTILDAYSGIGTISLPIAKETYDVIGIQINKEAYELANLNKADSEDEYTDEVLYVDSSKNIII